MSMTYVIEESQIKPFNMYHQGQRIPALMFREHLYVLKQVFQPTERLNAYSRSYELNDMTQVMMTVGQAGYRIWTDFSSAVPT